MRLLKLNIYFFSLWHCWYKRTNLRSCHWMSVYLFFLRLSCTLKPVDSDWMILTLDLLTLAEYLSVFSSSEIPFLYRLIVFICSLWHGWYYLFLVIFKIWCSSSRVNISEIYQEATHGCKMADSRNIWKIKRRNIVRNRSRCIKCEYSICICRCFDQIQNLVWIHIKQITTRLCNRSCWIKSKNSNTSTQNYDTIPFRPKKWSG